MQAPEAHLTQRTYNIGALAFTPAQLARAVQRAVPGFEVAFEPDFRQEIADTWPRQLDDSADLLEWVREQVSSYPDAVLAIGTSRSAAGAWSAAAFPRR